jgi:tetratricopeptide (TPR) repeat protein
MDSPLPSDLDSLWNYDKPAESEARFRDALAGVGPNAQLSWRLELQTQIARAQGLQRRWAQAHATLEEVYNSLAPEHRAPRVRYLLERGRVLNSSGSPAESGPLFEQAWESARSWRLDALAVDAAHMLAIVAGATGLPDHAMQWNQRAIDLANRSDDPKARRWLGSLRNNVGWSHHAAGRYEDALREFQLALDLRRERNDAKLIRVARWCVARTLRSLARVDEALAIQRDLARELSEAGGRDGYVQEELAECLHSLGRVAEARPLFAEAHALLSADPWLVDSEPQRVCRLAELGGVTSPGQQSAAAQ